MEYEDNYLRLLASAKFSPESNSSRNLSVIFDRTIGSYNAMMKIGDTSFSEVPVRKRFYVKYLKCVISDVSTIG